MKKLLPAIILVGLSTNATSAVTVLECEQLIDVEKGRVLQNQQIRIEDDRITEVGRQVDSPDDATRPCQPGRRKDVGHSKVCQFDVALFRNHEIGRLKVPMDNALLVRMLYRLANPCKKL